MLRVSHCPIYIQINSDTFTVTQAGPTAFANIHENYFYVFVGCSAFFLVIAYFFFPYVVPRIYPEIFLTPSHRETKQKTLEEIAASFGDKVVLLTEHDVAVEEAVQYKTGGGTTEIEERSVDKATSSV